MLKGSFVVRNSQDKPLIFVKVMFVRYKWQNGWVLCTLQLEMNVSRLLQCVNYNLGMAGLASLPVIPVFPVK